VAGLASLPPWRGEEGSSLAQWCNGARDGGGGWHGRRMKKVAGGLGQPSGQAPQADVVVWAG
jgi:hypothetical protein